MCIRFLCLQYEECFKEDINLILSPHEIAKINNAITVAMDLLDKYNRERNRCSWGSFGGAGEHVETPYIQG